MAIVTLNSVARHFKGSIDCLVFRQVNGKTVVSKKPTMPRRQSALQKRNRSRFRDAADWAKAQLCDPQKKSYYKHKAKKLNLPNAYTAAICDYMRKPNVEAVRVKHNKQTSGDELIMKIKKKDFAVRGVAVKIFSATGVEIASGDAVRREDGFVFKVPDDATCDSVSVKLENGFWVKVMKDRWVN